MKPDRISVNPSIFPAHVLCPVSFRTLAIHSARIEGFRLFNILNVPSTYSSYRQTKFLCSSRFPPGIKCDRLLGRVITFAGLKRARDLFVTSGPCGRDKNQGHYYGHGKDATENRLGGWIF